MSFLSFSGFAYAENSKYSESSPSTTVNSLNASSADKAKGGSLNKWTGIYGGLSVGGTFVDADLSSNQIGFTTDEVSCIKEANFSSFFPGLQVGYVNQFDSKIVLGVEGDFTYNLNQSGTQNCVCPHNSHAFDRFTVSNKMQGSVLGRIGYMLDFNLHPFLFAGASFADLGMNYSNEYEDYYSESTIKTGWLAGAGLEWGFSRDWSVRLEYYYIDYGTIDLDIPTIYDLDDPNGNAKANMTVNNVKLALSYWF
jgi:outer membrane immunogenic protein